MQGDNTVYLLVGQRGAGKSVYAEKILSQQPGISFVSRDVVLTRLFGSTDLSPYSGQSERGGAVTKRLLRRILSTRTNLKLIFDYWTGEGRDRRNLNQWLRRHGAVRVVALYFITSLPLVNEWFWKKPGVAKAKEMKTRENEGLTFFSENAPSRDYEVFHRIASDIASDGFDEVVRINPLEQVIFL
ncbi:MAG: hypothetical protein A2648_00160 [Candidatus Lloydbacteria bacterium RIFCSPHIGHO2_01_FULL_41_20]|uniref:UDP-N-acetylglucosamine kinase n=1 Tax=Candidatus Lloydbacteria bacterium RIFCSPHIGHO2_01_FULL_41_20 TaxID=1798657 RepID=A0A1G2CS19_9BACT|nr:MAG: hypothetical protein A2648_00160 [Candidatus Lloydbacteria bacterium RIFCSPHIGHO2_01_FULL_41_20]